MRNSSRFVFAILIIMALGSTVNSCFSDPEVIKVPSVNEYGQQYWDVDSTLAWEDFHKTLDDNTTHDAGSFVGLSWYIDFDSNEYLAIIHAYFQPDSSLVRSGEMTSRLLRHEQVHFNLAEIAARKARMKITNWPGPGDFDSFARLTIDSMRAELWNLHHEYDSLTSHGVNYYYQVEWDHKTDSILRSLDAYADPVARVELNRGYYLRD